MDDIEDYRLSQNDLKKYAEDATKYRERIKYMSLEKQCIDEEAAEKRRERNKAKWHGPFYMPDGIDKERKAECRNMFKKETPIMKLRGKRKRAFLSVLDKVKIVKSVVVDLQDYNFVSKKFGVSISCVSRLV